MQGTVECGPLTVADQIIKAGVNVPLPQNAVADAKRLIEDRSSRMPISPADGVSRASDFAVDLNLDHYQAS
jgi:hypothetical protein